MKKIVSQHAIDRARLRWLEPSAEAAEAAIRYVIAHGRVNVRPHLTHYTLGTRVVRVCGHTVVTVLVAREGVVQALLRHSRRDLHDRRRGQPLRRRGAL